MTYLEKFKITNKLVFVLGGAGLIGKEITKAMLDAGAKVVVLEKKKLNFTKKKVNFFFEKFDVT